MTGWNWDCSEECYRHAPEQYGAIHFHDDDLDDCGWETDVALDVPADLPSGVYALRLVWARPRTTSRSSCCPPRGTATRGSCCSCPTASYLAYANDHIVHDVPVAQSILGHTTGASPSRTSTSTATSTSASRPTTRTRTARGVCYSSSRRPIMNMRPKFRHATGSVWQFPADLHLVDWLHAQGLSRTTSSPTSSFTDEGAELLRRYRVVLTGSHPEYYSERMLDAWRGVPRRRRPRDVPRLQRLLLGHVVAPREAVDDRGAQVRVRLARLAGASRASTTSRRAASAAGSGAVARARRRSSSASVSRPRASTTACGYHQMPDARDPRAAFMLDGVGPDEVIGDFGLAGGGASGYEIDRYDLALGTPPNACSWPRASSTPSTTRTCARRSTSTTRAWTARTTSWCAPTSSTSRRVRAAPCSRPARSPGAGSLSHNGYDNNVSRIMRNVLDRFADEAPLPALE